MKSLSGSTKEKKRIEYREVGDGYICTKTHFYYSRRYKKWVSVEAGFYSDGATGVPDIKTDAWWVHDVLCRFGKFADGTPCTNWQASSILHDILNEDGYKFRAPFWRIGTFLFGGGAAREGKVYE